MKLSGKSVVVTGAGKGIGRAVSVLFAKAGARVVVSDIDDGLPRMVDYAASKGTVIAMTKALAIELGRCNVKVNCISPGSIDTGRGEPQTLIGRLGAPEEVAELALFLASPKPDFITGQNYIMDGGRILSTLWQEA